MKQDPKEQNTYLIVFEIDGVLTDTSLNMQRAVNAVRADRDREPLELDQVRRLMNSDKLKLEQDLLGSDEKTRDNDYLNFESLYWDYCQEELRFYDDLAEELSELLYNNCLLFAISQSSFIFSSRIIKTLESKAKANLFLRTYSKEQFKNYKPDPEVLDHIHLWTKAKFATNVLKPIYVSNQASDISFANAANVKMLLAKWGFYHIEQDTEDAIIVEDADDLTQAVLQLIGNEDDRNYRHRGDQKV